MENNLRVLIIEDSEDDAELLLLELRRGGYELIYQRVDTAEDTISALKNNSWDVVLADYMLPNFSAPAALKLLKSYDEDLPFIIVSGKIGEDIAVESLKAGAHDFIVKGNLARLIPAIEREKRETFIRKERRQAESALKKLSSAVEQTADAVIITSSEGIIEYVNSAFEKLTGYNVSEVTGKTPKILRSGQHDLRFYRNLWETILAGKVFRAEVINRKKNGEHYYLEEIITPVLDDKGVISHFVSTGRDITDRIMHEEQIWRQLQRLAALRDIDQAITANLDLSITIKTILTQVTTQLFVDSAAVLRLDDYNQTLSYSTCRGFDCTSYLAFDIPIDKCLSGKAIKTRSAISILNINNNIEIDNCGITCKIIAENDFKSYFAVPLLVKGNVEGVLELFHSQPLNPDTEWLGFLDALAGQLAIAIDNATMFSELQRSNKELSEAYDTTLEGWSKALDLRDQETEGHAQRVTELSVKLSERLGLTAEEITHVRRGALLHDIGKMGIPDSILRKPGPLNTEEWDVMRKHPVYAYILLSSISYLQPAISVPYCHHEKWDGTGYPRGLKGEEIPLSARIFAVVDVWDALRSDRPYRKGWDIERVRDYLIDESGSQFDPYIVSVFLKMIVEI